MPEPSDPKDPDEDASAALLRASSQYLGHGMAFAASVALFGWVGWWIGGRIGGQSVLTLFGMMLGAGASFYSIYSRLVVRPRQDAARHDPGSDEQ